MKTSLLLTTLALLAHGLAQAGDPAAARTPSLCGELKNAYGPYDYRRASTEFTSQIHLVESAHFTSEVERGIRGVTSTIGGDLDYTLRAFPNHPRALATLSRVALKDKRVVLDKMHWPVECYFDRALRFAPDDATVRGTYGHYLYARGQIDLAVVMFTKAFEIEPENATINYNLALGLLKQKQYEKANYHAQRAYALGFPLPGLKNMLREANKWDDTVDSGIKPKPPETQDEAAGADGAASAASAASAAAASAAVPAAAPESK